MSFMLEEADEVKGEEKKPEITDQSNFIIKSNEAEKQSDLSLLECAVIF